jgi:hypothetical protein
MPGKEGELKKGCQGLNGTDEGEGGEGRKEDGKEGIKTNEKKKRGRREAEMKKTMRKDREEKNEGGGGGGGSGENEGVAALRESRSREIKGSDSTIHAFTPLISASMHVCVLCACVYCVYVHTRVCV